MEKLKSKSETTVKGKFSQPLIETLYSKLKRARSFTTRFDTVVDLGKIKSVRALEILMKTAENKDEDIYIRNSAEHSIREITEYLKKHGKLPKD